MNRPPLQLVHNREPQPCRAENDGISQSMERSMTGEKAPRKARPDAHKRELIVQAFLDAMYESGIDNASMAEVGQRTGLDRSTIHYYFRTRDGLLSEAVEAITRSYAEKMERDLSSITGGDRARQLVAYMFSADLHQPYYSRLIDELATAGNRNAGINRLVQGMYSYFEQRVVAVMDESFPTVPARRRREVAYALSQLAEGATVYVSLGFDADRLKAARACAFQLLDSLGQAAASAKQPTASPSKSRPARKPGGTTKA
jgi:AcrR family transcriptional regulator